MAKTQPERAIKTQLKLMLTAAIIAIGQIFAFAALAAKGKGGGRGYVSI
ncbi:MAG: hypothetical protein ACR2P4_03050 [Gammaproteobacteria bacterium]